jgi:hypothetical protein
LKGLLFLFLFLAVIPGYTQTEEHWALGASVDYDFQTNGLGTGLRAYIPVRKGRLAISPQLTYYFPFNKITEYYAGLAVQYDLLPGRKWTVYPLLAAYYDRWINYSDYIGSVARANNFSEEAGIGIMKGNGCLRPFLEGRYDFKWSEFNMQAGLLFFFGDCFNRAPDLCPAYF